MNCAWVSTRMALSIGIINLIAQDHDRHPLAFPAGTGAVVTVHVLTINLLVARPLLSVTFLYFNFPSIMSLLAWL